VAILDAGFAVRNNVSVSEVIRVAGIRRVRIGRATAEQTK
jgi:hypothetical protein